MITFLALGATLGQGWFFGRPTFTAAPQPEARALNLPSAGRRVPSEGLTSPFACFPTTWCSGAPPSGC